MMRAASRRPESPRREGGGLGTPAQRAFVDRVLHGLRRHEWRNHIVRVEDGSPLCRIHDVSPSHRLEGGGSAAAHFVAELMDGERAFVKVGMSPLCVRVSTSLTPEATISCCVLGLCCRRSHKRRRTA